MLFFSSWRRQGVNAHRNWPFYARKKCPPAAQSFAARGGARGDASAYDRSHRVRKSNDKPRTSTNCWWRNNVYWTSCKKVLGVFKMTLARCHMIEKGPRYHIYCKRTRCYKLRRRRILDATRKIAPTHYGQQQVSFSSGLFPFQTNFHLKLIILQLLF